MLRKKPSRQQARESYNKSEAPRRISAEKDERAAADTAIEAVNVSQGASITNQTARLDSHDNTLTNMISTNTNQTARLDSHDNTLTNMINTNANQTARLDSHDTTLTNMINTNANQTARLDSHDTSLTQINAALTGKVETTGNEQISGNKLFANLRIFSDGGATVQIRYNATQGLFGAVI